MEDLLKRARIAALCLALLGSASGEAQAIYLRPMLQGLTSPALVTNAGDGSGRLFIVELAGVVKVLPAGSTTPTLYLDITDRVLHGGERGLLGLAFHPDFGGSETRFYVNYTREGDGATVISMRHGDTVASPNPAATSAKSTPVTRATDAAANALCTLCAPRAASSTSISPHGVHSRNAGRRSRPTWAGAPRWHR